MTSTQQNFSPFHIQTVGENEMALVSTSGLSVLEAMDEANKMQGGQFCSALISASQKSPETKRRQISPFLQPWLRSALSDVQDKDSAKTRDCE